MKKNNFFPRTLLIIIFIFLPIIILSCGENKKGAELVYLNARVITLDESNPFAEAIAVEGDRIKAVGSKSEIEELIGDNTKIFDLGGNFVYPGFNDSHAHFLGIGRSKMELDLRSANNWDEIVYLVVRAVEKSRPGEWIIGRGWHQDKWNSPPVENVEGYPVHKVLSQASSMNPVILTHASGHAIIANQKAMELAGITNETADPEGGRIVKDDEGNPIGVFEENGEELIQQAYRQFLAQRTPEQVSEEKIREVELAVEECLANGITSLTDAGENFETIDFLKKMVDEGILKIRLNVMIQENNELLSRYLDQYKLNNYGDSFLTVRSIKKYIDGALGSRGAWLLESYEDLPGHTGLNVTPLEELQETARIAAQKGFQMCTHAIGDKANREILNIYENEFSKHAGSKDFRWRVEHAQHLSKRDIPRFAKLGVIAAMQGIHCTSDAVFVTQRLGDLRSEEGAYVWRKLIDTGAIICNGTDSPVERVNPLECFYSSVTRKYDEENSFYSEQKMTRLEALKSYTINGAYASFEENIKGTITPGKLADFTVLNVDLLNCPENEIRSAEVLYTIVGGKILFEKSE